MQIWVYSALQRKEFIARKTYLFGHCNRFGNHKKQKVHWNLNWILCCFLLRFVSKEDLHNRIKQNNSCLTYTSDKVMNSLAIAETRTNISQSMRKNSLFLNSSAWLLGLRTRRAVSERYRTGLGTGIPVEFELMDVWLKKSIKYRIQRSRLRPSSKDEAEIPTTSLHSVFCSQTQTLLDVFNDVQPTSQRFVNRKSLLKYLFVTGFLGQVTLCEGPFPQCNLNKIPSTWYIPS